MKCPKCKSENRPGVKFCETCGAPMEKPQTKPSTREKKKFQGVVCPDCGTVNRHGVKFCETCGALLENPVKEPAKQKKVKGQVVVCSSCSAENRQGVKFCETCGASLEKPKLKTEKKEIKIKEKSVVCFSCGARNRIGVRFCETCGRPMEEKEKITQKREKSQISTITCPACGAKNRRGVVFCEACGESLAAKKKSSRKLAFFTNFKSSIQANPYKVSLYAIAVVGVLAGMFFLIQSMRFEVTKAQARKMADSTIASRYTDLVGTNPVVTHATDGSGHFSTYAYTRDMHATMDKGGEMEYSITVVVRVNRSTGEYDVFDMY